MSEYISEREDFIRGLRELADWMEATPEAKPPIYHDVNVYLDSKEEAQQLAKYGKGVDKRYVMNSLYLQKRFGDIIRYTATIQRDKVCRKVVKGTQTKEVLDYANVPRVTKEVEVVEWLCDPLLAPTESEA